MSPCVAITVQALNNLASAKLSQSVPRLVGQQQPSIHEFDDYCDCLLPPIFGAPTDRPNTLTLDYDDSDPGIALLLLCNPNEQTIDRSGEFSRTHVRNIKSTCQCATHPSSTKLLQCQLASEVHTTNIEHCIQMTINLICNSE